MIKIVQIYGLHSRSLASRVNNLYIRRKTTVLVKGCGLFGQLGRGSNLLDSDEFIQVKGIEVNSKQDGIVTNVSAGWGHSITLDDKGKISVFGMPYDFINILRLNQIYSISGFLARMICRSTLSGIFGDPFGHFTVPTDVFIGSPVKKVVSSVGFTVVLTQDKTVQCFGINRWNQCGINMGENMHEYYPVKAAKLPKCKDIDVGLQHAVALTSQGEIYSWGKANRGQLGNCIDGEITSLPKKVDVSKLIGKKDGVLSVSAGFTHGAALTSTGDLLLWGKGMSLNPKESNTGYFRIFEDQMTPRKISLPNGLKIVEIQSGNVSVVMRADDDSLWAIGMGEYDRNMIVEPIRVQDEDPIDQELTNEQLDQLPINYVKVPKDAIMRKGHKRVSLIYPTGSRRKSGDNDSNVLSQYVLQVVLHKDEAYLMRSDVKVTADSLGLSEEELNRKTVKIVDYSEGWKHTMMVIEKSE